jgi:hypothetical protein
MTAALIVIAGLTHALVALDQFMLGRYGLGAIFWCLSVAHIGLFIESKV